MTFLDEVRKKLDLPPAEKEQVMRELESHYHEVEDEALSTGMNKCEASAEAAKRLGDPSDIAQRMQAVHTRATWKMAFLTALPFLGFAFINILLSILGKLHISESSHNTLWACMTFLAGTIMLIGGIREIKADRRPLWLATWLPMGIQALAGLIPVVTSHFHNSLTLNYSTLWDKSWVITAIVAIYAIPTFFVSSLALWTCWRSVKWKSVVIGFITFGLLTNMLVMRTFFYKLNNNSGHFYNAPHVINASIFVAVMLLLAIRLFMNHPYGNKIQTSLMLYVFINAGLPIHGNGFRMWLIVNLIISGLAVLLSTRAEKSLVKQWILCIATLALWLMKAVIETSVSHTPFDSGTTAIFAYAVIAMGYIAWIVLLPELIDRYYKKHKPELAR